MRQACPGMILSRIMIDGKLQEQLTPLNDAQRRILELMKVALEATTGS